MNTQEPINKKTLNSLLFYCHNCNNFVTIKKDMNTKQYKVREDITTFILRCPLCNDSYCFYTVMRDGRIDISHYGERQETRLEKVYLCFFCNELYLSSDMIEIPLVGNVCNACYLRSKQNEAPM